MSVYPRLMSIPSPRHIDSHFFAAWEALIPLAERLSYIEVIASLRAAQIPHAVGGALALASYTGLWRDTKDLDFYVLPDDRDSFVAILTDSGWSDYYETRPYDRGWIYRATRGGNIIDVIFAHANHSDVVGRDWIERAWSLDLNEIELPILSPEELIRAKIYVLQRDRCDWMDIFNLLYSVAEKLEWDHVIERLGESAPLLGAIVLIFAWLAPGPASKIPQSAMARLTTPVPFEHNAQVEKRRADLLDLRPWFAPQIKLKVSEGA